MVPAAVGVVAALSIGTAFGQTSGSKMAGKSMANKMMDQQMIGKVDKLSVDQKAAMFDKMPMEKRISVMHDESTMGKGAKKMEK
jgi:hypothetical protein